MMRQDLVQMCIYTWKNSCENVMHSFDAIRTVPTLRVFPHHLLLDMYHTLMQHDMFYTTVAGLI